MQVTTTTTKTEREVPAAEGLYATAEAYIESFRRNGYEIMSSEFAQGNDPHASFTARLGDTTVKIEVRPDSDPRVLP